RNKEIIGRLIEEGRVRALFETEVKGVEDGVVLLETKDGEGRLKNDRVIISVGGELPTGRASPATEQGVRLFCLDPVDGKVLGQTDLPLNTMPEETFRDFAVLDEGGVVYQYRTESGVSLRRADCR
ncbi:MAG: hypothetical protein ACXU86_00725, partial [Archangium sp.]